MKKITRGHSKLSIQIIHNEENFHTHIITPSYSCPTVLSPLTCSPPVSHLGSEDTDAVHHHQLHQENFHQNIFQLQLSRSTTQPLVAVGDISLPSVRHCLLLLILFTHPSISLSSLSSHPLHLSVHQSDQRGLLR